MEEKIKEKLVNLGIQHPSTLISCISGLTYFNTIGDSCELAKLIDGQDRSQQVVDKMADYNYNEAYRNGVRIIRKRFKEKFADRLLDKLKIKRSKGKQETESLDLIVELGLAQDRNSATHILNVLAQNKILEYDDKFSTYKVI